MAQFFAGTSGWAYSSWKPAFYPEKLAQTKFLIHYSRQLNTVEVNFSFRQLLKETTVQKWLDETPPEFRFAIKAHQVITHIKRLKATDEFVKRFITTLEPLEGAAKLGPVLFQLPPNLKKDCELLNNFLPTLPRAVRMAFEFRHPSWFCEETYGLLRNYNAALCVAETEQLVTPNVTTAGFAYYRYRKPEYSDQERTCMVDTIRDHQQHGRDVYAYFKHEETPQGALYALEILKEFGGREGPIPRGA
ncbi:MAG: DUF72 domain-containing protein [Acidobacteria bacterium]|nr:DUF72 domain-containing protein [Acidobacteriota bacterium]